jgi:hypothetical protein
MTTVPPYVLTDTDPTITVAYPVKIGDPENPQDPDLGEGKLSLTRNLTDTKAIKEYVGGVRVVATHAEAGAWPPLKRSQSLSNYFNLTTGSTFPQMRDYNNNDPNAMPAYSSGGRRRRHKTRKARKSRRKHRKSRSRR